MCVCVCVKCVGWLYMLGHCVAVRTTTARM